MNCPKIKSLIDEAEIEKKYLKNGLKSIRRFR